MLGTHRQAAAATILAVEALPSVIGMSSLTMQWIWKGTGHLQGGLRACMRLPDMVQAMPTWAA